MTTVMFNTKDYSFLGNVSVMEIIDELQRQFIDKSWDFQGVRMVSDNVYICLSQPESLQVVSFIATGLSKIVIFETLIS